MSITISREQFEQAIDDTGLAGDIDVREDYSGRAMYGAECLGVVCDARAFALLCAALGASADDWDWVGDVRTDSMGRSAIWYWPSVTFDQEGATDDDA